MKTRISVLILTLTLATTLFSSCQKKLIVPGPPKFTDPVCLSTYSRLYEKDELNFKIVFGYKDARPARFVGDRYERAYLIQKLLEYGFQRVRGDDETLRYVFAGPDHHTKTVQLKIISSSAGADDDENRHNPYQHWMSSHAESEFLTGLQSSDLIFYYGHSRDGGGPDFAPPVLDAHNHVAYGWYLKHEPGLRKMIAALKQAHPKPKVLGLYSCVSNRLFAKKVLEISPSTALLLSNVLLYYKDAIEGMFETLRDVLEMKCQPDFHPAGTQMLNFF